ncbi:hypothetical protein JYU34_022964, partial [Plutella xylostella]
MRRVALPRRAASMPRPARPTRTRSTRRAGPLRCPAAPPRPARPTRTQRAVAPPRLARLARPTRPMSTRSAAAPARPTRTSSTRRAGPLRCGPPAKPGASSEDRGHSARGLDDDDDRSCTGERKVTTRPGAPSVPAARAPAASPAAPDAPATHDALYEYAARSPPATLDAFACVLLDTVAKAAKTNRVFMERTVMTRPGAPSVPAARAPAA